MATQQRAVTLRPVSSFWANQKRLKYHDVQLNKNQWLYDKPAKRRDRDHLLVPDSLFFVKFRSGPAKGWRLIGRVTKVEPTNNENQVLITVEPWRGSPKGFNSKNAILEHLGSFKELSDHERIFGLIPLHIK